MSLDMEGNKCPYCGRFMKVTRERILKVNGIDSGQERIIRKCGNKSVDHEWDWS